MNDKTVRVGPFHIGLGDKRAQERRIRPATSPTQGGKIGRVAECDEIVRQRLSRWKAFHKKTGLGGGVSWERALCIAGRIHTYLGPGEGPRRLQEVPPGITFEVGKKRHRPSFNLQKRFNYSYGQNKKKGLNFFFLSISKKIIFPNLKFLNGASVKH